MGTTVEKIKIFKGDDTDHSISTSIDIVINPPKTLDVTNWTGFFQLQKITRTISEFPYNLVLTNVETSSLTAGDSSATLVLIDTLGRRFTASSLIPFSIERNRGSLTEILDYELSFNLKNIEKRTLEITIKSVDLEEYQKIKDAQSQHTELLNKINEDVLDLLTYKVSVNSQFHSVLLELGNRVEKVNGYGLSANDFSDLLKAKLESLENYDDTQVKSDFSTHIQSKNAHGSTVIPAADTIIIRNAEGRAQVNAPQAAEDIARLFEISKEAQERKDGDNTLANAIDGHLNDSIPHGAESDAVPETLIIRDEFGCAQVGTPQQPEDIARLFEVASEQEERKQAIIQEQEERIGAVENETKERKDADKGLYDSFIEALKSPTVEPTPNTLVIRTSQGTAKVQAPQENDDAATKAYTDSVQTNLNAHENTINPHGAVTAPTADRLAMFDGDGRLKSQHPVAKDYSSFVATTTWVRDFVFPVGCFCTQYPGEATPATKYGGTWTIQTQFNERFARGSGNSAEAFRGAGLPNITGEVVFGTRGGAVIRIVENANGAFRSFDYYPMYDYTSMAQFQNVQNRTDAFNINASRSSGIYGASSTVQPADYPLVIWKRTA